MGFKYFKLQEIYESNKPVCYKIEATIKPEELEQVQKFNNIIITSLEKKFKTS